VLLTVGRMFQRTPRSSSAVDASPRAELSGADLRVAHLQEWRDAAKRVTREYEAWCAAAPRDRPNVHCSFLDALTHEEGAARQLALGMPAPGTVRPTC
jgi:hypothetical protein